MPKIRALEAEVEEYIPELATERDELLAFHDLSAGHWVHLRTTNPIESMFSMVKLRTKVTREAGSPAVAGGGHLVITCPIG